MKEKRRVYRVRWVKERTCWIFAVFFRGKSVYDGDSAWGANLIKKDCVDAAAACCRDRLATGKTSQLVVHNKDGRVAFERTYGKDPRRSKG